ncbi:Hypothetical_protein [Hexamita inflata]|uniref:Hypothetical_protein n=1 Tax=Hexamita inflata TaxID=28002 RepID=A0AA86NH95_9EUKA|nr:Hypothetical protein HINF_LOCUS7057 [Hexamita inflata]
MPNLLESSSCQEISALPARKPGKLEALVYGTQSITLRYFFNLEISKLVLQKSILFQLILTLIFQTQLQFQLTISTNSQQYINQSKFLSNRINLNSIYKQTLLFKTSFQVFGQIQFGRGSCSNGHGCCWKESPVRLEGCEIRSEEGTLWKVVREIFQTLF